MDFEQWMAGFDILKPSVEETFLFYRMMKYAGGELTSDGDPEQQTSAMNVGLEALRSLSLIRQRYRQAMLGTDINIHFDNNMAAEICEAMAAVIHAFVPEDKQTEAENMLWALVGAKEGQASG